METKKQFLKLTVLGGVLLSTLMVSINANAVCWRGNQKVERVLSYGTYGYVYVRPINANLTNSTWYYMYTTSDKILANAASAKSNNSIVNVYGDAATCPATGYIGTAIYLYNLD